MFPFFSLFIRWSKSLQGMPSSTWEMLLFQMNWAWTDCDTLSCVHSGPEGRAWWCSKCEYNFAVKVNNAHELPLLDQAVSVVMVFLQVPGIRGRPGPMVSNRLLPVLWWMWPGFQIILTNFFPLTGTPRVFRRTRIPWKQRKACRSHANISDKNSEIFTDLKADLIDNEVQRDVCTMNRC